MNPAPHSAVARTSHAWTTNALLPARYQAYVSGILTAVRITIATHSATVLKLQNAYLNLPLAQTLHSAAQDLYALTAHAQNHAKAQVRAQAMLNAARASSAM